MPFGALGYPVFALALFDKKADIAQGITTVSGDATNFQNWRQETIMRSLPVGKA